jgi:hypothetical protein
MPKCDEPRLDPQVELHGCFDYRICDAINLSRLSALLQEMINKGVLHPIEARTFQVQASCLVVSLRSANNRSIGKGPVSPIDYQRREA